MSIFGLNGSDPEQESGLLQFQDTLDHVPGIRDVLDTGWSPPDRPWAVGDWGMTEWEESTGEGLGGRLARELAEREDEAAGDGLGDTTDTDGELIDREVGCRRAGRLLETGAQWGNSEPQLHASDVGIDGAAASAEEAAVHLVSDWDDDAYDGEWR
jgi:hypothetical protein